MTIATKRRLFEILFPVVAIFMGGYVLYSSGVRVAHREADRKWHQAAIVASADATSTAIISLDKDGKITQWSEGAEKLFGYSSQEMIGAGVEQICGPALAQKHSNKYLDSIRHATASGIREVRCKANRKLPGDKSEELEIKMLIMSYPPIGATAIVLDDSKVQQVDLVEPQSSLPQSSINIVCASHTEASAEN